MKYFKYKYSGSGRTDGAAWEFGVFENLDEAEKCAYQEAYSEYESYGDLHGIGLNYEEWMEENWGCSEDDFLEADHENAENTIEYFAIEISKEDYDRADAESD